MTTDANDLEEMAKEHPNTCFLKGSGVLKLLGAIRSLEAEVAALKAQPAPTEAAQGEDSARLDVVVEANRALLHERSQLGIKKYGDTLEAKRYPHKELLMHALLEALDLSNYLQAAIMGIDRASAETGGVKP